MGEKLVSCNLDCKGIVNSKKDGIPPRCLFLEKSSSKEILDCIIVGINPGNADKDERKAYKEAYEEGKFTYNTEKEYFKEKVLKKKYFTFVRRFAEELGWDFILWTDMSKCESSVKDKVKEKLPIETKSVCIQKFLKHELNSFQDIPIIALGNEVYDILYLLFQNRPIVGIPHPTGARGFSSKKFLSLFKDDDVNNHLKEEYKMQAEEAIKNKVCVRMSLK